MKQSAFIGFLSLFLILFISCNRTSSDTDYIKKVELNNETIAVGLYKATGFNYPNLKYIAEAINIDGGIVYVTLTDADVLKTKLENIDVIIFPAMKTGEQFDKFDDEIASIFRNFILSKGKGAIGFCNGASLLSTSQKCQSLNIIDVDFEKNISGNLEEGIIACNLTEEGRKIFPELEDLNELFIDYKSSSEIVIKDTANIDQLFVVEKNGVNYPLIIKAKTEKGKLVLINASPETTPGMRWIIPRLIRWSVNKDLVWYDKTVFRPKLFKNEVILTDNIKEEIDQLMNQLDSGKKNDVIKAMNELQSLYPWIAAEKVRTLLIQKNDDIKLHAAKYLVDNEYTIALEDFNKVIKTERSKKVREQLIEYRNQLANMKEQN